MSGNTIPVPNRDEGKAYRLERSVLTAASQINLGIQESGEDYKAVLLTLTYKKPDWSDWSPTHITRFMTTVRNHLARKGSPCRYVWVCELQKRGAPHYHIIFWLPPNINLPKPDNSLWWTHGLTRIETAKHPVGYLVGYAKKNQDFSGMPKGVRVCGSGGLTEEQRKISRWWKSPSWLKKQVAPGADIFPAPGGGWVDRDTGEWFPPEWSLTVKQGRFYMIKRVNLPKQEKPNWTVEYVDQKLEVPDREATGYENHEKLLAKKEIKEFINEAQDRATYLNRKRSGQELPPFRHWMEFRIASKQRLQKQNPNPNYRTTVKCPPGPIRNSGSNQYPGKHHLSNISRTGSFGNVRGIGVGNSRRGIDPADCEARPIKMISKPVPLVTPELPPIDLDYDPYT